MSTLAEIADTINDSTINVTSSDNTDTTANVMEISPTPSQDSNDNIGCFGFILHNFNGSDEYAKWVESTKIKFKHNLSVVGLLAKSKLPITLEAYNHTLVLTKVTSEPVPMVDLNKTPDETLSEIPMAENYIVLSESVSSSVHEELVAAEKNDNDTTVLKSTAQEFGRMVAGNGELSKEETNIATSPSGLQKPLVLHKYEYILVNYKALSKFLNDYKDITSPDALEACGGKIDHLPFIKELCNELMQPNITSKNNNMKDIASLLKDTDLYKNNSAVGFRNKLAEAFDTLKYLCQWKHKKPADLFMRQLLTARPEFGINTNITNSLIALLKDHEYTKFKGGLTNIDPTSIVVKSKVVNTNVAYYRRVYSLSYTNDVANIRHNGILSPVYNASVYYRPMRELGEVYPNTDHIWPDMLYDASYICQMRKYSVHDYIFQTMDYQLDSVLPFDEAQLDRPIFQYQMTCQVLINSDSEKVIRDGHSWDFRFVVRTYVDRNIFNKWLYNNMTPNGILLARDTAFFLSMCNQKRELIGSTHFDMNNTDNSKGQEAEEEELANKDESELCHRVIIYQRTPQNSYHPSWRMKNEEVKTRFAELPIIKGKKEVGKVEPFSYQMRNVIWMSDVENRVDAGQHVLQCPTLGLYLHNILKRPFGDISSKCPKIDKIILGNKPYFMNQNVQRVTFPAANGQPSHRMDLHCIRSGEKNVNMNLELMGGIIADDVGLGKTLTTIYHMANQLEKDKQRQSLPFNQGGWQLNNLIIVPSRLLKQWELEITKFFGKKYFNVITIGGVAEIRKIYKNAGITLSAKDRVKETAAAKKKADAEDKKKKSTTDSVDPTNDATNVPSAQVVNDKKPVSKSNAPQPTKKYDVYIVSVNLLTNSNYWQDVLDNTPKKINKDPSGKIISTEPLPYDIEKCFDLFRIKWNRVIVDEAHECVQALGIDSAMNLGKKITNNDEVPRRTHTIFNIQSNYRWGLTATPFEHKEYNLAGYLGYLAKAIKNDMTDLEVINKLYFENFTIGTGTKARDIPNLFNTELAIYKSLNSITNYLDRTCVDDFQRMCLTKTSKRSVSSELDIPIFTEEVIPITLGPIERNIYNNAKTDNSRSRDRLRRLFQLCTNICISRQDMESLELNLENNMMSLSDLNAAMVAMFSKQQKKVNTKLTQMKKTLASYEVCIDKADAIYKTMHDQERRGRSLINRVGYRDKSDVDNYLRDCFRAGKLIEENGLDSPIVRNTYGAEKANVFASVIMLRSNLLEALIDITETDDSAVDAVQIAASSILEEEKMAVNLSSFWAQEKVLYLIKQILKWYRENAAATKKRREETIARLERENTRLTNQIKLFENTDFLKEKTEEPCPICWVEYEEEDNVVITDCRHILCGECFEAIAGNNSTISCPECRAEVPVNKVKVTTMAEIMADGKPAQTGSTTTETTPTTEEVEEQKWMEECINKYGTKMATLIRFLRKMIKEDDENGNKQRAIIFSQYDDMLKLIGTTLDEYGIHNIFPKGNVRSLSNAIDKFKQDDKYRVIMLSSERSNSGSNLTEANNVIIVDVLNMDRERTKEVESQIIGRAVRLGQKRPVKVVRLVTQDTVESEYFNANRYDIATIQ